MDVNVFTYKRIKLFLYKKRRFFKQTYDGYFFHSNIHLLWGHFLGRVVN